MQLVLLSELLFGSTLSVPLCFQSSAHEQQFAFLQRLAGRAFSVGVWRPRFCSCKYGSISTRSIRIVKNTGATQQFGVREIR